MTDPKLLAGLDSKNSLTRRQAIMRIGKLGDEKSLKVLAQVYKEDTDADLRELAKEAAKQIRERQRVKAELNEIKAETEKLKTTYQVVTKQKPTGAELKRAMRDAEQQADRLYRRIFGVVAFLLLTAVVTWFFLGQILTRLSNQAIAEVNLANAVVFDVNTIQKGASLNGAIYKAVTGTTTFYIIEPRGTPPSTGWTLVFGVSNGSATAMAGSISKTTSESNFLLVLPELSGALNSGANVASAKAIFDVITRYYPINLATATLYGSGSGADFVSQYVSRYPTDYAVVSLSNGLAYQDPPSATDSQFILLAGGQDASRAQAAIEYKTKLDNRSRTVAYFAILKDYGNQELPEQIQQTFDFVKTLAPNG